MQSPFDHLNRREFISTLAATTAGLSVGWPLAAQLYAGADSTSSAAAGAKATAVAAAREEAKRKLKILILGGTGFLGPHTVRAALARGHTLTLFNRGKSNPGLFPEVERLVGDRYEDISALKGRTWDVVIDNFAYVPGVVRTALEALAGNIQHYIVISSISVYPKMAKIDMDEAAEVGTIPAEELEKIKTHREMGPYYGPLKALCEQEGEKLMPGRTTAVRAGLIVGPDDPSDRFTYWPARFDRGGEVLAPGTGDDFIQVIDVRDLGEWLVHCAEERVMGIYNAITPARDWTMKKLLDACNDVAGKQATVTWLPVDFLGEQQVQPWSQMPVWLPREGDYAGAGQISVARAVANGLKFRSIKETVADTLTWWRSQPADRRSKLKAGLSPERELQVLAEWKKRGNSPRPKAE